MQKIVRFHFMKSVKMQRFYSDLQMIPILFSKRVLRGSFFYFFNLDEIRLNKIPHFITLNR
nr:MAG TPA: hypothetical protein [Caudoviricetes sp.]